jgi:hypothetical protein
LKGDVRGYRGIYFVSIVLYISLYNHMLLPHENLRMQILKEVILVETPKTWAIKTCSKPRLFRRAHDSHFVIHT